jgi:3-hydroxyisobutyrate dehydrogenase-like beta-hydroxyacid dehydrogenase
MNVGFIGVGAMGAAMVPNLVKAGHQVQVWNRNPAAVAALADVSALSTPAAAFANEVVLTMLADDKAVRSVIIESGALTSARKDCVHVMMATISPELVDELAELHQANGLGYVSAPVFGVPAAAAAAQLNIVAAGAPEAIAKVQPLFDVLGQKTWRVGDTPRLANIAKIAGNMMITLAIEAMGEASALTESYGLKAKDFLDIVTSTLFAAPSYKRYGSFIASDTFEPGFKLPLGLKDVNLALDAAKATDTKLPAAEIVRSKMLKAIDDGLADKDWSVFGRVSRQRG